MWFSGQTWNGQWFNGQWFGGRDSGSGGKNWRGLPKLELIDYSFKDDDAVILAVIKKFVETQGWAASNTV